MTFRRGLHWLALATLLGSSCDKTLSFDASEGPDGGEPGTGGTAGAGGRLIGEAGTGEPWTRAGSPGTNPPATGGSGFVNNEECEAFCASIDQRCHDYEQTCVECFKDQDCEPFGLYCDYSLNRCASCNDDYGCPADTYCDDGECRELCLTKAHPEADCRDDQQFCLERRSVCISCLNDDDCAGSPDGPRCVNDGARCAECASDSHCPRTAPHCDPLLFRCVECTDSRDCWLPYVCHPEAHVCADSRLPWPFPT
jgi:hypothetical protein